MSHHSARIEPSASDVSEDMIDAMGRRKRFGPSQPRRTGFEYTWRDHAELELLDIHGFLDTKTINRMAKARHLSNTQHTLGELYHGYCDHPEHRKMTGQGGKRFGFPLDAAGNQLWEHVCVPKTLVARHPDQDPLGNSRDRACIYNITPLGRSILPRPQPLIKASGWLVHDFFCSRVTAAFHELMPSEFKTRRDILRREQCPEATRTKQYPFVIPLGAEHVEPDQMFYLAYIDGGFRYCIVESERFHARSSPEAARRLIRVYNQILTEGLANETFGIRTLTILIPVIDEATALNLLKYVREIVEPRFHKRFLTKVFPQFGDYWQIPDRPLDVVSPWLSAAGLVDISKGKAPS